MIITLCELKGMISTAAIENPDHNYYLGKVDCLIAKFGLLAKVESEMILRVLYGKE